MQGAKKQQFFTKSLLDWFEQNDRPLPWKGEKNPYLVWLSEIILQQTRVEQGLPYFERFREAYPKVQDLANAPEDEVMKLWEGLGYYSRARNLHFTAKYITNELNGEFPTTYEAIIKLKGIGAYTAAAIASFAHDLPHAVVDGNVYRVLARIFGIQTAIDSTAGKKEFAELAQELLAKKDAAKYNQAIMDFGATHCTPKAPRCSECPMQQHCTAFAAGLVDVLPYKAKKLKKRDRYFHYFIFNHQKTVLIQKRIQKDIWQNLYEFPMLETPRLMRDRREVLEEKNWQDILKKGRILRISKPFKQVLSHQNIYATFWEFEYDAAVKLSTQGAFAVDRKGIHNYAFPRVIDRYLQEKNTSLELF